MQELVAPIAMLWQLVCDRREKTYYSYVLFLAGRDDAVGKKFATTEKSINEADIS